MTNSMNRSTVLFISVVIDRLFYQAWAFPPLKFLLFNVVRSLAVFYGRNDWHYYISQGFPLLLTTALPFTLIGLAKGFFYQPPRFNSSIYETVTVRYMTITCLILPSVLSLIGHKEVRFIYPILPLLHIITSPILVSYFKPALLSRPRSSSRTKHRAVPSILFKRFLLLALLIVNIFISLYTSQIHAPGPLNVLNYLRNEYIEHYLPPQRIPSSTITTTNNRSQLTGHSLLPPFPQTNTTNSIPPHLLAPMTVGFFMPCHSTPWRTHLIYPSIHPWALTCEPPLTIPPSLHSTYLDEADLF